MCISLSFNALTGIPNQINRNYIHQYVLMCTSVGQFLKKVGVWFMNLFVEMSRIRIWMLITLGTVQEAPKAQKQNGRQSTTRIFEISVLCHVRY